MTDTQREPRFLITGSSGCIGAWIVRELLARGHAVTTFSRSAEPRNLRLLIGEAADAVPHVRGDVTDAAAVEDTLERHQITNVIHLAAALIPECQADPAHGARVNVIGTLNVFEAVKRRAGEMAPVVYASSVAAYDAAADTMFGHPGTHYGAFKRSNEDAASIYWQSDAIASVGLRPFIVYGVGREHGLTAAVTRAMLAAALQRPYTIPFGGRAQLQLAADGARAFIEASLHAGEGATVHNIPGPAVTIAALVDAISAAAPASAGAIDFIDMPLPFAEEVDASSFASLAPDFVMTPIGEGAELTIGAFRDLIARELIAAPTA